MSTAPTIEATVTIKPVQCPVCKTFNPVGVMFCIECGLIFDRALEGDVFGSPTVQLPSLTDPAGREHWIRPGSNSIGRSGDIIIEDSRVSRRHAQLSYDGTLVLLEDLESTNGTQLNGESLAPGELRPLEPGDTIGLGGYLLTFSAPGTSQKTEMGAGGRTAQLEAAPTLEQAFAYLIGDNLRLPLKEGQNTFGRKVGNDVVIADPYVSGSHGVIEIENDEFWITDLGSTNGTLLNGAKLSPNMRTSISSEDVIRLGSIELRVVAKN